MVRYIINFTVVHKQHSVCNGVGHSPSDNESNLGILVCNYVLPMVDVLDHGVSPRWVREVGVEEMALGVDLVFKFVGCVSVSLDGTDRMCLVRVLEG